MARELYRIEYQGRTAALSFSKSADAQGFQSMLNRTFDMDCSSSWSFVINSISYGVDWPTWWPRYESQRKQYIVSLNGALPLETLSLAAKKRQEEMWRRHGLCRKAGILTCENVHYPDFFEVSEIIAPPALDKVRESFPFGSFGYYVMACPPKTRLLDPENPGPMNEIWATQREFFVDNELLVPWPKIPAEVVATTASNQDLRKILMRYGAKASLTRALNESNFLDICRTQQCAENELKELSIPKMLWCRMPPSMLTWSQLQAYRWLVRGLGGSLFDMYEGLSQAALAAPE